MELRDEIRRSFAELLLLDEANIEYDEDLFEYGLNSISLIRWMVRLELDYGINIKAGDMMRIGFSTIQQVAFFVQQSLADSSGNRKK